MRLLRSLPVFLCVAGLALVGCGSSSDSIAQVMPEKGNGEAPPSSNGDGNGGGGDTGSAGNAAGGGDADPSAPNGGSLVATGTVLGQSLSGVGNMAIVQLGDDGKPASIIVSFATKGLSCGFAQSHAATFNATPSERVVTLSVQKTGLVPDTYQVGATGTDTNVNMHAAVLDSECQPPTADADQADATNGTVTIKTISDALVEGSFDVRFANGDHVTGTFSSGVCDMTNPAGDDSGTCM